jgi:hypothetical protein
VVVKKSLTLNYMRIWNEQLIPHLCRQHLLAQWRESLGCYKIVTGQVDGGSYYKHPMTKEFILSPMVLFDILRRTREEMLKRGYNPKELPNCIVDPDDSLVTIMEAEQRYREINEYQTVDEQIAIIKQKGCKCCL